MKTIRLEVCGYTDSDPDERAALASQLRVVLLDLDMHKVEPVPAEQPDTGKGTSFEWAQLLVTTLGALPPLIAAVQSWLKHHPGATVDAEIDGDKISLTDATDRERESILSAWLSKHG